MTGSRITPNYIPIVHGKKGPLSQPELGQRSVCWWSTANCIG